MSSRTTHLALAGMLVLGPTASACDGAIAATPDDATVGPGHAVASAPPGGALVRRSPHPAPASSEQAAFNDPVADAAALNITDAQLGALAKGIFTLGSSIVEDRRPAPPPDTAMMRPPAYEGRGTDGKLHIATDGGLACLHFAPHTELGEADCFGAILSMAADGGSAGSALKRAYDDAVDKREFARGLGRALQLSNERQATRSDADVASMQAIPIGTERSDVYAKLRAREIVVYNDLYNPGKSFFGGRGCEYDSTRSLSAYPMFGEPFPPSGCEGASREIRSNRIRAAARRTSPDATARFGYGFDLACGYERSVELDFDRNDRLSGVVVSPERHTCV